jgi:Flp pilus assembly pilin Flp
MMSLLRDETGTTLTEYGVLMASLALPSIAGMLLVQQQTNVVLGNLLGATTTMELCPPGTTGCPGG